MLNALFVLTLLSSLRLPFFLPLDVAFTMAVDATLPEQQSCQRCYLSFHRTANPSSQKRWSRLRPPSKAWFSACHTGRMGGWMEGRGKMTKLAEERGKEKGSIFAFSDFALLFSLLRNQQDANVVGSLVICKSMRFSKSTSSSLLLAAVTALFLLSFKVLFSFSWLFFHHSFMPFSYFALSSIFLLSRCL